LFGRDSGEREVRSMGNDMLRVKGYFHKTAEEFDSIYTGDKNRLAWFLDRLLRRDMFDRFNLALSECGDVRGKRVLDVGCGSGRYSVALAERGAGKVVGIDFAENMIDLSERLAAEQGVGDVCEFICDDFLSYDFELDFHISLAIGFFDYTEKPLPFLKKMRDITLEKVIATFPRKWTYRMPIRKARLTLKGCPVYFYAESDIADLLGKAGFKSFHMRKVGKIYLVVARPRGGYL